MTPKPHLLAIAWLLALLLAACASAPLPAPIEPGPAPRWLTPNPRADSSEMANLLRYVAYIDKLDGPDLESEYRLTAQELSGDANALNRLRMALLISLASGPVPDEANAPALLEPLLLREGDMPSQSLRDLAILLHAVLEQRSALRRKLQSASAQLLEERKRAESVQQKLASDIEVVAQKVRDQQARCELLERKIEEVKQIEKSMTERPSTAPRRQ
jgi:hypothetical protein